MRLGKGIGLLAGAGIGFAAQAGDASFGLVASVEPSGLVSISCPADSAHYFLLRAATGAGQLGTNEQMLLGRAGTVTFQLPPDRQAMICRVVRLEVAQPGDADGDELDDVYELRHPPLNPVVADANISSDGDTLTNLEEFKLGTDPGRGDTDGDGFGDDDELADGSLPLDPSSRPINPLARIGCAESLPVLAANSTRPPSAPFSREVESRILLVSNQRFPADPANLPRGEVGSRDFSVLDQQRPVAPSLLAEVEARAIAALNTAPPSAQAHAPVVETRPCSIVNQLPPVEGQPVARIAEARPISAANHATPSPAGGKAAEAKPVSIQNQPAGF